MILCPSSSRTCTTFQEIPYHPKDGFTLDQLTKMISIQSICFGSDSPKTDGTVYYIGFAICHSSNKIFKTKLSLVTFLDNKTYFANFSNCITNLAIEIFKLIIPPPHLTHQNENTKMMIFTQFLMSR